MAGTDDPPQVRYHWAKVHRDLGLKELDSLALYLRATNGQIDPCVAKKLADMIDGPPRKTGWRLKAMKHPKICSKKLGREQWFEALRKGQQIALYMAKAGGARPGGYEAALLETAAKFGLSPSTVKQHWKLWRTGPRRRFAELLGARSRSE